LIFGTISTREDMMQLMEAVYTGYHCVAEIFGENANDVLSRLGKFITKFYLEAVGIDLSILPKNMRIVVPAEESVQLRSKL
jgi:Tfp pilus assembly ATPase PilU